MSQTDKREEAGIDKEEMRCLQGKRIGFAMCGSFCTHAQAYREMEKLATVCGAELVPILSDASYTTDTRFGTAEDLRRKIRLLTGTQIIHTIERAEPLGPVQPLDLMIVCPCTGNTLAKSANGITDTPICMAVKAHMRTDRALVLALASNDAMSANLRNLAVLLGRKQVYFVPMWQDDPEKKPHSLVADFESLQKTIRLAMEGRQPRPLFLVKERG